METAECRDAIEKDLVYVSTFALKDPLRPNIEQSVQKIRYGRVFDQTADSNEPYQVNIRMMTGDHLQTARAIAIQCGIINDEEANEEDVVMTGAEFREKIGAYNKVMDYNKKEYRIDFMDRKKFDELKKKVKVIARCTSEDKFVFVCGIKSKGGLVGMTGSTISDAEALRKADVGLSMGTGCDVAKDNSDLVILDNNFESIYKSIMWGRAIFDNVRKFL